MKELFDEDDVAPFAEEYGSSPEAQLETISTLAHADNDNGWPLGMLAALKPQFAKSLEYWTSSGYTNIRNAQEGKDAKDIDVARCMEEDFACLPLWHGEARHYSKSSRWFKRLSGGSLQLRSFMSCCRSGHSYAYALNYKAVLIFKKLKSARLVGALTKENLEGEVLLPKGARFEVVSIDETTREIVLSEVSAIAQYSGSFVE